MRSRTVAATALLAVLLGGPTGALAFSSGVGSGSFPDPASGCNHLACHGGGLTPTVTISGPATVTPNSLNEYVVTVFEIGSQSHAGLNAGIDAGSLLMGGSASAGTQLLTGEITHTAAKAAVGGEAVFSFLWDAPASGAATLSVWGNAVNLNSAKTGDAAGLATLAVTVMATPTPTPSPTPTMTPSPTPTPAPPAVPTLDQTWGLTLLVGLMLICGLLSIRRQRYRD